MSDSIQTDAVKAVLFDLDDTLFDFKHSRLCALQALQQHYPQLGAVPLDDLEREHERQLQANFLKTLDGTLSTQDARKERLYRLCAHYGMELAPAQVEEAFLVYRETYQRTNRAIPGAIALLRQLQNRTTLGVVTNGLVKAQRDKLRICGVEDFFDFVLVSEEINATKPDEAVFTEALRRANTRAEEAVFIGDTWKTDILGSHQCGIRSIWLNRYGADCPQPHITSEIHALEPVQNVVDLIFADNF